tara:strand:+ start:63813 stop:64349 length:537 start_codon:yes stop_codon:yes gene_type:complete
MILLSNNLRNYMSIPDHYVIRVNLAWTFSLDDLVENLNSHTNDFFIDIPSGRSKPPSNKYSLEKLYPIFREHENVKYVAISNVETSSQLDNWSIFGKRPVLVPKIESIAGVLNIDEIMSSIDTEKIIMIDHDDLHTSLLKNDVPPSKLYSDYIDPLLEYCAENNVIALRTRGIVFSDE